MLKNYLKQRAAKSKARQLIPIIYSDSDSVSALKHLSPSAQALNSVINDMSPVDMMVDSGHPRQVCYAMRASADLSRVDSIISLVVKISDEQLEYLAPLMLVRGLSSKVIMEYLDEGLREQLQAIAKSSKRFGKALRKDKSSDVLKHGNTLTRLLSEYYASDSINIPHKTKLDKELAFTYRVIKSDIERSIRYHHPSHSSPSKTSSTPSP